MKVKIIEVMNLWEHIVTEKRKKGANLQLGHQMLRMYMLLEILIILK